MLRSAFASNVQAEPATPDSGPRTSEPRTRLDWRETLTFADNESIASILLKLEQVPTREIAIVAPSNLRVFRNPVSMRLLQRKAEDLGLDITIISDDEMTRQLCAEIGFGCYGNVKSFKRENTRPRSYDGPGLGRQTILSGVAGLCLAALAGIVALFVLPSATVEIVPGSSSVSVNVPVEADSNVSGIDLSAGKIPAKIVTSGIMDGSSVVSASGQRDLPSAPAKGFVTFTNRTGQPVFVPKNTIVQAGKVAFFTVSDTQVPPTQTIAETAIQGSASASIQAAEPGEEGNVAVGAITAIQGGLSSQLSVVNRAATTGGAKKRATYLSADDQAKAKQALLNDLRRQALDKVRGQIPRNETFLPSPDSDGENAIEELTYEESPEQVTTQTRLHMKVLLRGLTFQGDDVNQVVAQSMDAAVRQRAPGTRLDSGPLVIDPPAVIGNDGSTIKMQVHTTGRVISSVNPSELAEQIRGLPAEDARLKLLRAPGVGDADVQLWPAWSQKVPSFSWRIHASLTAPQG